MEDDLSQRIEAAVARVPEWLRRDLSSNNEVGRKQAEETLAMLMLRAIKDQSDS